MKCLSKIDIKKACELTIGVIGLLASYIVSSAFFFFIKQTEEKTQQQRDFHNSLPLWPTLLSGIITKIYVKFAIRSPVTIPFQTGMINGLLAALLILIASRSDQINIRESEESMWTFTVSGEFFLAGNIVFTLFSVYCSKVRDQNLRLGKKQIITSTIIAIAFLSNFFILLLPYFINPILAIFIGALFFDRLASIKSQLKPTPAQLMANVTLWQSFWILLIIPVISSAYPEFLQLMKDEHFFNLRTLAYTISTGIFIFFVYWMVIKFRQHLLPYTFVLIYAVAVPFVLLIATQGKFIVMTLLPFIAIFPVLYEFYEEIQISQHSPSEARLISFDQELTLPTTQNDMAERI